MVVPEEVPVPVAKRKTKKKPKPPARREKRPESIRKIAFRLKIPYATFLLWNREGMPREGDAAIKKWKRDNKEKPKQEKAAAADGLTADRRALNKIRRKQEMLNYLRDKGKLVYRKAVEQRLRKFFTDARVQLETIPSIVARCVPEGENRELAKTMVTNIIHNVLKGLAAAR